MTLASRLPTLPKGFVLESGRRGVLAARPDDLDALRAAGFLPDNRHGDGRGAELADAEESGREPLGRIDVAGQACLARRFTHGGLARVLTGRRFLDPARPFEELVLSERLRGHGIPTPRVVAARAVATAPFGFELTLVTERLPGTIDVGHLMGAVRRGAATRLRLRAALVATARLVRRLHDVGFLHADLQPANVLVPGASADGDVGTAEACVLDLDRSRFDGAGPLDEGLCTQNLGRLWRHVRRREREYGPILSRADIVRFLTAYGTPRESLRDRVQAIESAAETRGALHRIGWWLERRFGRRHDARAHDGHSASTTRG